MKQRFFVFGLLTCLLVLSGCNLNVQPTPTATNTPIVIPTITPMPSITPLPSVTSLPPATQTPHVIVVTATPWPTSTPLPATPVPIVCDLTPRLGLQQTGRVTTSPWPNAMRSTPGTGSNSIVLGNIDSGAVFTVLEGPVCADGYYWWRVNASGFFGWTAEGHQGSYWLEPYQEEITIVDGWYGWVLSLPQTEPGNAPDDYFRQLLWPDSYAEYGIDSTDPHLRTELESLRGTNRMIRVWGELRHNVPDYGNTQINVTAIEFDAPPLADECVLPTTQHIGYSSRIVPGPPNAMRDIPGTDAPSSVLGYIPGGTIVRVLDGPVCANGYQWWYVHAQDQLGWTPEGVDSVYWVEPVLCANGQASRFAPGMLGRVALDPPIPNALRAGPGTDTERLGEIPPGGLFTVLDGPTCDVNGMTWWQVSYGELIGWTPEGDGATYWLEPMS